MTDKKKSKGIGLGSKQAKKEVRKLLDKKSFVESNAKVDALLKKGQVWNFEDELEYLYQRLANMRHSDPTSPEAQKAIGEWYKMLQRMGTYSMEAFKSLGQTYVTDPSFKASFDEYGEGLAVFMRDAMIYFADNAKE